MDCTQNPTDPVCQEIYGNGSTTTGGGMDPQKFYFATSNIQQFYTTAPSQTPIAPGTIVTSAPAASSVGAMWAKIPTVVKLLGAGALAFVGYKKFLAKPTRALSGGRRRR